MRDNVRFDANRVIMSRACYRGHTKLLMCPYRPKKQGLRGWAQAQGARTLGATAAHRHGPEHLSAFDFSTLCGGTSSLRLDSGLVLAIT